MLFEALTASVLGWWIGVALVVVLPLALASLALLAPVALEEGRLPAGFNPDQWRSLGLLATSQHAPWSLALMGAQRLSMVFGGATAIFLTGVLSYVGYAGRLDLQGQLNVARQGGAAQQGRVADLQKRVGELEGNLADARGRADNATQRAATCQQDLTNAANEKLELGRRLETERDRRATAESTLMREQVAADQIVGTFNRYLQALNRQMVEQCPAVTPIPRPGSLPEDPDAPRPPAPPWGQRPSPRPPSR
jgi:hypothetical protein